MEWGRKPMLEAAPIKALPCWSADGNSTSSPGCVFPHLGGSHNLAEGSPSPHHPVLTPFPCTGPQLHVPSSPLSTFHHLLPAFSSDLPLPRALQTLTGEEWIPWLCMHTCSQNLGNAQEPHSHPRYSSPANCRGTKWPPAPSKDGCVLQSRWSHDGIAPLWLAEPLFTSSCCSAPPAMAALPQCSEDRRRMRQCMAQQPPQIKQQWKLDSKTFNWPLWKWQTLAAAPWCWRVSLMYTGSWGTGEKSLTEAGAAVAMGEAEKSRGASMSEIGPISHCSHALTINRNVITTVPIWHS